MLVTPRHCCRLAADALKGKGQPIHRVADATGIFAGGTSREASPVLDTLLPGYLSRPNPSPAKARHPYATNHGLTISRRISDLRPGCILARACRAQMMSSPLLNPGDTAAAPPGEPSSSAAGEVSRAASAPAPLTTDSADSAHEPEPAPVEGASPDSIPSRCIAVQKLIAHAQWRVCETLFLLCYGLHRVALARQGSLCLADQSEGGFLVHGRPAAEYRTHKPTAAISDFTVNRASSAAQPLAQHPARTQPPEPASTGGCRQ